MGRGKLASGSVGGCCCTWPRLVVVKMRDLYKVNWGIG
jgi:hypothetical protein